MCGADCWTDHRMLVSKLIIRIRSKRRLQGKKSTKRFNVDKLQHEPTRQICVNDLEDKLEDLNVASSDIEANWCERRTVFNFHGASWLSGA